MKRVIELDYSFAIARVYAKIFRIIRLPLRAHQFTNFNSEIIVVYCSINIEIEREEGEGEINSMLYREHQQYFVIFKRSSVVASIKIFAITCCSRCMRRAVGSAAYCTLQFHIIQKYYSHP